jgi:pyroglutamyl-peptidase
VVKILVSGYSSWARAPENPSTVVIENLKQRDWPNVEIRFVHMPVASESLYGTMAQIIDEFQPDAWLGMGVAGREASIQLEKLAINRRHFPIVPDIDGLTANQLSVVDGGPLAIEANFPNEQLIKALTDSGVSANISFHAGTHLCNQMLYIGNYLAEQSASQMLCGFVHIPYIKAPEGEALKYIDAPKTMDEEPLTNAIALLVRELSQHLREKNKG